MFRNLFGRGSKSEQGRVEQIGAKELQRRLAEQEPLFLLDVRSPEEFRGEGRIGGSQLIPLPVLPVRLQDLPRDRPIVCICRSGSRSQSACDLLARQGFTQLINLRGGMLGWRMAGLEIQRG